MNHPILNKIWKALLYLIFWGLFSFLYYSYSFKNILFDNKIAILESTFIGLIQFSLNIGLWYILIYNRIEEHKIINLVGNIILTALFMNIIWIFGSHFLILLFNGKNPDYTKYFWNSLWNKSLMGIIIYFVMILFYYLYIYYQNFKENLIRKNQLASKLQEQELANLKSQINPHFLFNSLNSISYLVYEDAEKAHNAIVKLSDYFRYSLSSTKNTFITLKQEIENTHRYLAIEKIRFPDKMEVVLNVSPDTESEKIPILILQPIIENAVKHGVYESTEIVKITIDIQNFNDFIKICIKNNYDIEAIKKPGTGLGLKNVKQRLELIYNRTDLLKIENKKNIFKVELFIPKI